MWAEIKPVQGEYKMHQKSQASKGFNQLELLRWPCVCRPLEDAVLIHLGMCFKIVMTNLCGIIHAVGIKCSKLCNGSFLLSGDHGDLSLPTSFVSKPSTREDPRIFNLEISGMVDAHSYAHVWIYLCILPTMHEFIIVDLHLFSIFSCSLHTTHHQYSSIISTILVKVVSFLGINHGISTGCEGPDELRVMGPWRSHGRLRVGGKPLSEPKICDFNTAWGFPNEMLTCKTEKDCCSIGNLTTNKPKSRQSEDGSTFEHP